MKKLYIFVAIICSALFGGFSSADCHYENIVNNALIGNATIEVPAAKNSVQNIVYVNANESMYAEKYYPTLTLKSDRTFLFTVNLGQGMGDIRGTYVNQPKKLILYVSKIEFAGYAGDDAKKIVFLKKSDGSIVLRDPDVGIVLEGSVFTRVPMGDK